MNPLKFSLGYPCLAIISLIFIHMIYCTLMSLNCMLQINCNGHDFVICRIMVNHYCIVDDTLDMVQKFFKSLPSYIHATKCAPLPTLSTNILNRWKPFNLIFSMENTFMDVIVTFFGLQFKDIVIVATPKTMLQQNNKVTNIWKTQFIKLVLNMFELSTF